MYPPIPPVGSADWSQPSPAFGCPGPERLDDARPHEQADRRTEEQDGRGRERDAQPRRQARFTLGLRSGAARNPVLPGDHGHEDKGQQGVDADPNQGRRAGEAE